MSPREQYKYKIFHCLDNNKMNQNIAITNICIFVYKHFTPFYYKITFVNLQHMNTNSKGDFLLKNQFETFFLKISKEIYAQIWYAGSN